MSDDDGIIIAGGDAGAELFAVSRLKVLSLPVREKPRSDAGFGATKAEKLSEFSKFTKDSML